MPIQQTFSFTLPIRTQAAVERPGEVLGKSAAAHALKKNVCVEGKKEGFVIPSDPDAEQKKLKEKEGFVIPSDPDAEQKSLKEKS